MSRRAAREVALKALFQVDLTGFPLAEAMQLPLEDTQLNQDDLLYARELCEGVLKVRQELDKLIGGYLVEWTLDRLATVDRNVLRIACYEILHCPDVPVGVAINEAIELAKVYNNEEAGSFINGLLDRIRLEVGHGGE